MTASLQRCVGPGVLRNEPEYARRFATARPFRHVAIDGFFSEELAQRLAASFPAFDERLAINENGEVGAKAVHEKGTELGPDWRIGRIKHLLPGPIKYRWPSQLGYAVL